MPEFVISVPEVWRRSVTIEADSLDEAISEVLEDGRHMPSTAEPEYSSTLGPDEAEWIVLSGPGAD